MGQLSILGVIIYSSKKTSCLKVPVHHERKTHSHFRAVVKFSSIAHLLLNIKDWKVHSLPAYILNKNLNIILSI